MKKVLVFLLACLSSTVMFAAGEHYVIDQTGCQSMYTRITGVLAIDHVQLYNGAGMQNAGGGDLEIGVFDQNGICRGAKKPTWRASASGQPVNKWIYQLQIRGNDGFVYHFKVYDHATGTELDLVDDFGEVITYVSNLQIGSLSDLYEMNFTHPTPPTQTFTKDITGYGENEGQWYLISSPIGEVAATDVDNMTNDNGTFDLYYFYQACDNEGNEWINYKENTENGGGFNLLLGKGYLYANSTDVTLTFTGTPYDGDGVVTLVRDNGFDFSGWNLVGNPFGETAYIDRNFYVMNEEGTEIVAATENAIAPMQGIFVLAEENGETLTFSTGGGNTIAMKSSLALNLTQGRGVVDRAVVRFGHGSLPKFQLNPNHTKVYIPMEGKDYAVVSAEAMGELPVNFEAEKNGSYSLSFTSDEVNFSYLHLIDNLTGNDVNLLETPSYSFNATTSDYASRFRLVFATSNSVNGDNFSFLNSMGNLCIFGIEGEATVQVIDVLGHVLSSETFSGSYEKRISAAPGVYMIRLIQGNDVKVQKVVVK